MTTLVERVARTIRRHDLLPPGTRVIAAVSGGADSVAMLHLLRDLAPLAGFELAGLAHVNHALRGAASDADEQFCLGLAARLGLPAWSTRVDVAAAARTSRLSLEDAARRVRYRSLEEARRALRADRVAVGHTADDQAETVLLKLLRGAGARGVAGIHPRVGHVVRPLLDVGRDELRAWLAGRSLAHVEDATNQDLANPRNYLRLHVLPELRARFGPGVASALARAAEVAREEDALLTELAAAAGKAVLRRDPGGLRLSAVAFTGLPLALQRRVILDALREASVREPGFEEVETVRGLALSDDVSDRQGPTDLPGGVRADRNGAHVVLSGRSAGDSLATTEPFRYPLPVPGTVWVREADTSVEAFVVPAPPPGLGGGTHAVISAERVAGGLAVRSWQPGDWLRPVGLGGRKKVQDVFVDRKVARAARHRLPLVVDADDRVVWVPGHALDEGFRAGEEPGPVVVLKLTPQRGGP